MSFKGLRRSDIIIDLAQAYLDETRYDESIKLLMSTPYFVNWEGSGITWDIFSQSHIRKGIELYNQKKYQDALTHFEAALIFPGNLGVGHSARTEVAEAWFWKGKALIALGKPDEAVLAWQMGSISLSDPENQNSYEKMCKMLLK
jgi:tetratricopeptide (TPR) repeat protein